MSSPGVTKSCLTTGASLRVLSYCLLAALAYGQNQQSQLSPLEQRYGITVRDALAELKSGNVVLVHLTLLSETGVVEAIPDLEKQFASIEEKKEDPLGGELDRLKIAQVLVKLGDKNDTYWDYLVQHATPAIESDAPNPVSFDREGKSIKYSAPSPELVTWAKAHNLDPADEAAKAVYVYPGYVMLLAATEDKRAIPLLRRALLSPNYFMENVAAMGLAEIHDEASIPTIIEACRRAPTEAAATIARSLVYFDDSRAQSAVDLYVPKEQAKIEREVRAMGRTPWH